MAAPSFVQLDPDPSRAPRAYESPVRRPDSWRKDRPAELGSFQPRGPLMGSPGPDIGYAIKLLALFGDKVVLTDHEHAKDAAAGATAIAMKRAALFGRAPVVHDLTLAYTVFGFLDAQPDPELVAARKELFTEAGAHHGYPLQRRIADAVPDETLRKSHTTVADEHRANWRTLLSL